MWIPHTRGLEMYFYHHPEKIGKVKGGCDLDCVGADPVKYPLQFYVALPPYSIPNYLTDIANNMIDYFMQKITKGIYGGPVKDVLYALEGSRNMFSIVKVPARGGGSDQSDAHSFPIQVPSVYFYDWPYPPRHSQINFLEYMDRTNLRRISYLGAIISYTFASADEKMAPKLWNEIIFRGKTRLSHELVKAQHLLESSDSVNLHFHYQKGYKLLHWGSQREKDILESSGHLGKENQILKHLFSRCKKSLDKNIDQIMGEYQNFYFDKCKQYNLAPQKSSVFIKKTEWDELIPVINSEMKTFPGCGQNYGYFNEILGQNFIDLYPGIRQAFRFGSKALKDYLNYIDGQRTIRDIHEAVQAELWSGDYKKRQYLSFDETVNFFKLLKDVNIISFKKK